MNSTPDTGYEMLDHPADLRFRVWAPDREALFRQAARALIEILFAEGSRAEGPGDAPGREIEIELDGADLDDLLVRWLGELLFQADTRRLVPESIRFDRLDGERLRAVCGMRRAGVPGCEIKAVTYHQSGIRDTGGVLEATLLFDA